MNEKEMFIRLIETIFELKDKLAESQESSNYWYKQCTGKEESKK